MTDWNVLDYCASVDGKEVSVDPHVIFPAVIERLASVEGIPHEIVGDNEAAARRMMDQYKAIPQTSWDLALRPYGEFMAIPDDTIRASLLSSRAVALAFVDTYFSRAISVALKTPVHLHISKNEDYKR